MEGQEQGQRMTLSSAIQRAAAPLAKGFSEMAPTWETDELRGGLYRTDPDTGETQYVDQSSNPFSQYARIRTATSVGSSLTALASGQAGVAGSLGATAARFAGPIGLAYGATQLVGGQLEKQSATAAPYRQAYGEDTSMFAARDRFERWKTGLSGFGTIGGDMAREQFDAATQMGLRGESLDGATDFGREMYSRFGMDTSQSMQIVEQSVKQGNLSLTQFSEAITEVSRAAVEAGRSSKEAISDFSAAQQAISTIAPGDKSIVAAKQISGVVQGLPTALAESLGGAKGLANGMTQTNIQRIAMMSGQDPQAALFQMMSDPEAGTQDYLANMGTQIVELFAQAIGVSASDLRSFIGERTGGKPVSYEQQMAILSEIAGGSDRAAGIAMQVLQNASGMLGLNVDLAQLLNLLFSASEGGFGITTANEQKITEAAGGISSTITGIFGGKGGGATGPSYGKAATGAVGSAVYGGNDPMASLRSEISGKLGYSDGSYGAGGAAGMAPMQGEAFNAYVQQVAQTGGQGNAMIEAILSAAGSSAITERSGTDIDSTKIRIGTGRNAKDMTLAQIIEGGYEDQLQGASIVPGRSGDQPADLRVTLELSPEAKRLVFQQDAPSDEQRAGVPAPSGSTGRYY